MVFTVTDAVGILYTLRAYIDAIVSVVLFNLIARNCIFEYGILYSYNNTCTRVASEVYV